MKAALTVAPVEPDLTLPPNEISKEKAKEEGVNEAMEEGANEAKEGGDDVGDEEEQKDEGEKEEEDGADAEAQRNVLLLFSFRRYVYSGHFCYLKVSLGMSILVVNLKMIAVFGGGHNKHKLLLTQAQLEQLRVCYPAN